MSFKVLFRDVKGSATVELFSELPLYRVISRRTRELRAVIFVVTVDVLVSSCRIIYYKRPTVLRRPAPKVATAAAPKTEPLEGHVATKTPADATIVKVP